MSKESTHEKGIPVSDVFNKLLKRAHKTVKQVAEATGLNENSLYGLSCKNRRQANLETLKVLADYFDEDVTIFLGLENYERPLKLDDQEKIVLKEFRNLPAAERALLSTQLVSDTLLLLDEPEKEAVKRLRSFSDEEKGQLIAMLLTNESLLVLDREEQELIEQYRSLNDDSQRRATENIADMASIPKNKREGA